MLRKKTKYMYSMENSDASILSQMCYNMMQVTRTISPIYVYRKRNKKSYQSINLL